MGGVSPGDRDGRLPDACMQPCCHVWSSLGGARARATHTGYVLVSANDLNGSAPRAEKRAWQRVSRCDLHHEINNIQTESADADFKLSQPKRLLLDFPSSERARPLAKQRLPVYLELAKACCKECSRLIEREVALHARPRWQPIFFFPAIRVPCFRLFFPYAKLVPTTATQRPIMPWKYSSDGLEWPITRSRRPSCENLSPGRCAPRRLLRMRSFVKILIENAAESPGNSAFPGNPVPGFSDRGPFPFGCGRTL